MTPGRPKRGVMKNAVKMDVNSIDARRLSTNCIFLTVDVNYEYKNMKFKILKKLYFFIFPNFEILRQQLSLPSAFAGRPPYNSFNV